MGYAVPEEFLARARQNPKRMPASYAATRSKKTRKRQRLEAKIRDAIQRYMGERDVFVVPRDAQALIDAGMPPRAAYELVQRTWPRRRREPLAIREYEFLPRFEPVEEIETSAAALISRLFGTSLTLSDDETLELVNFELRRKYGKLEEVWVQPGNLPMRTAVFFSELRDIEGNDAPPEIIRQQIMKRLNDVAALTAAREQARAFRPPKLVLRFAKKTEEIDLSSLQHSDTAQGSDFAPKVRYRTLDPLTIEDLPEALAGIMLRTKKEGRRLAPFIDTSLENPMSYWEKQYSKSPYGPSRSIPAARRNAGRPRTSKKTGPRTNVKKRTEDKWPLMRVGKKRLETMAKGRGKDSKEAKRELEYRKILRGDSSTSKARGKDDKVTKGKNLSDWQAFQHEMRGKGMTSTQMSAAYRKAMDTKKKASSSTKKSSRKASTTRKAATEERVVLRFVGTTAKGNKSDKFYVLSLRGRTVTAHYGSTSGGLEKARTTKKTFKSAAAARKAFDSTVKAKKNKGYKTSRLQKLHGAPSAPKARSKKTTTSPRRTSTRAKGRKVASKSARLSKLRKGANRYRAFMQATMADGYSHAEARAIWHHEKGAYRNPRDLTHRREALVPSHQLDYWDNSVETALLNPEYEDYDDFDYGPFSTGRAVQHGSRTHAWRPAGEPPQPPPLAPPDLRADDRPVRRQRSVDAWSAALRASEPQPPPYGFGPVAPGLRADHRAVQHQ
jgi:predicted DNA-binding WGR domain protein